jgi:hypothetical protein
MRFLRILKGVTDVNKMTNGILEYQDRQRTHVHRIPAYRLRRKSYSTTDLEESDV